MHYTYEEKQIGPAEELSATVLKQLLQCATDLLLLIVLESFLLSFVYLLSEFEEDDQRGLDDLS